MAGQHGSPHGNKSNLERTIPVILAFVFAVVLAVAFRGLGLMKYINTDDIGIVIAGLLLWRIRQG